MRRYHDIYREMDDFRKMLENALSGRTAWKSPFSRTAFLPGLSARQYPLMNLSEDKDHVYLECLAPGIDPDTLDISILRNTLTISGQKIGHGDEAPAEAYHRSERATGKFIRTMELTTPIREDGVSASYKNGLLVVTLPKTEEAKPRRIAITAG